MRSTYTLGITNTRDGRSVGLVRDQDAGLSVTNDAENVVREILQRTPVDRIFYRDTEGQWDELVHDGQRFTGFAPIRDAEGRRIVGFVSRGVSLPDDPRFPMLCPDGTVLHSVDQVRAKEKQFPGSFTAAELADFVPSGRA